MKSPFYKATALILIQIITVFAFGIASGQADSAKSEKETRRLKNSVKINLTNPMIFGDQCYWFGYERTIGDHQSFEINIGRFSFPKVLNFNTDSIEEISKETSSRGFHISGEYRFYLAKENKFKSPHGVYIGPYASYNTYSRYFKMTSVNNPNNSFDAKLGFDIASIGFQLGYQFVLWNRVSLDMVLFGPGIAAYRVKTSLSTTLDPDQESELFQKINDAIASKIPGYDRVISPGEFARTGSIKTTSLGFRYVIMLGFRF